MRMYAVVLQNMAAMESRIPLCTDDMKAALDTVQSLALSKWAEVTGGKGDQEEARSAMRKAVENDTTTCVTLPGESNDVSLLCHANGTKVLENGDVVTALFIMEVERTMLSMSAQACVAADYAYENLRTSVLYRLQETYPDADMSGEEVQKLVDVIASSAEKDIGYGCDEDWSMDEEFRVHKKEIIEVFGEED